jgi:hypothetical protein
MFFYKEIVEIVEPNPIIEQVLLAENEFSLLTEEGMEIVLEASPQ